MNLSLLILKFMTFFLISAQLFAINPEKIKEIIKQASESVLEDKKGRHLWNYGFYEGTKSVSMYYLSLNSMGILNESKIDTKILSSILIESQNIEKGYWQAFDDKKLSRIIQSQSDLDSTIINYFTLKSMGHLESKPYMLKARDFIVKMGGIEKASAQILVFLAFTENISWDAIPEVSSMLLFPLSPIKLEDFSNWVTTGLAATSYLKLTNLTFPIKLDGKMVTLDELWIDNKKLKEFREELANNDDKNKVNEDSDVKNIKWLKEILESKKKGKYGAINGDTTTTLLSLMAFHAMSSYEQENILKELEYNYLRNEYSSIKSEGIEFIDFMYVNNSNRELNYKGATSQGSYWDTLLSSIALINAGVDNTNFIGAADKIRSIQNAENGGVGYGLGYENIPDTDDTAAAIILWSFFGDRYKDNILKATNYILEMQNDDDGFATFNRDRDGGLFINLFIDSDDEKQLIFDNSANDITANSIRGLTAALPYISDEETIEDVRAAIEDGFEYIDDERDYHNDWSYWKARWGVNYIYGTYSVVTAKHSAGIFSQEENQNILNWLQARQNEKDGGYGETFLSYNNSALAGRGVSSPTQTAWALMTLLKFGDRASNEIEKAVQYLVDNFDKTKKTWSDDGQINGTGVPNYSYLVYPGYAKTFTILALSEYIKSLEENDLM